MLYSGTSEVPRKVLTDAGLSFKVKGSGFRGGVQGLGPLLPLLSLLLEELSNLTGVDSSIDVTRGISGS
jgi:hypothetical protein